MAAIAQQLEFPFSSLDFPGQSVLTVHQIAEKLGVTDQHILDLIEEHKFPALDLKGKSASRRLLRIPIEIYRDFIIATMTGPYRRKFMADLPRATLRELKREIDSILSTPVYA